MKKTASLFLFAVLAISLPALSAQKLSGDAIQTPVEETNAYTALKWSFESSGRKYAQGDTLTFVSDSATSPQYVSTRDFGPKGRNQQAVNYFLPDSLIFCVEAARVDADTNTTVAFFQASVNGGTFFGLPAVPLANDLGITSRALYCVARKFIPGVSIKPQLAITTATDTNAVYSARLFGK